MLEDDDHDQVRQQIQLATRLLDEAEDILDNLPEGLSPEDQDQWIEASLNTGAAAQLVRKACITLSIDMRSLDG
jgi:hypothetical protein